MNPIIIILDFLPSLKEEFIKRKGVRLLTYIIDRFWTDPY